MNKPMTVKRRCEQTLHFMFMVGFGVVAYPFIIIVVGIPWGMYKWHLEFIEQWKSLIVDGPPE